VLVVVVVVIVLVAADPPAGTLVVAVVAVDVDVLGDGVGLGGVGVDDVGAGVGLGGGVGEGEGVGEVVVLVVDVVPAAVEDAVATTVVAVWLVTVILADVVAPSVDRMGSEVVANMVVDMVAGASLLVVCITGIVVVGKAIATDSRGETDVTLTAAANSIPFLCCIIRLTALCMVDTLMVEATFNMLPLTRM